jgi:hypothetical protein
MSPLRSSQRAGFVSTLILFKRSPRSSLVSTIKSPRRRGKYKVSEVHHNLGDSRTTPSPSRGQVPKINEHTEIVDEVLELKIERSLKSAAQISPRKLRFEWSLRERSLELKRVSQSVCNLN